MIDNSKDTISHFAALSFLPPKTIVIVGLMGAGKTSIGKRLAARLGLPFYDSDLEIEKAAGRPCKEVYEVFGQEEFSNGERRVIMRLLDMPIHVLSTGGCAFINDITRDQIKEKAISVWLKADINTLLARVSRRNDRPLLEGVNQQEVLEDLIKDNYPVYELADVTVETYIDEPAGKTVDRVIGSLADYIRTHFPTQYILKSI
jgi:shikimate kinase